jgi:16S rRNA (cytosine1402-N4)-methyltransferase
MNQQKQTHQPVLLKEVLQQLQPAAGESYLDVTAGYGGHAEAILEHTQAPSSTVLVDRDSEAAEILKTKLGVRGATILHQDFSAASKELASSSRRFSMILADLGVSSPHLENAERGFSIKNPGPLDMRMDRRQHLTAEQLVNKASEKELAEIFKNYGEEPKAARIASQVVATRPITSTEQLAAIAAGVWPGRSRVHPATRIFQALRIAVNDELSQLAQSLPLWLEMLEPGGRIAIISFHSLEDRIVKRFFTEHSAGNYDGELQILTKKPLSATNDEIVLNPRARSARLRAAAKIKTKRKDHRKARHAY